MNVNKFNIKENKSIIKEIYSFSEVRNLFDLTNNQDVLVILDVDDVLITPSNEDNLRHPYRNQLLQLILNRIKLEEIKLLKSKAII